MCTNHDNTEHETEEAEVVLCANCNDDITDSVEDAVTTLRGEVWCESCYSDTYCACDRCNSEANREEIRVVDGDNYWCESCAENGATSCDNCGDFYRISNITECNCSGSYCENCLEDHQFDCSDCRDREINIREHGEALKVNGASEITDYHPDVNWEFITDKHDCDYAPHFGVELEIECERIDNSAKKVGELLGGYAIASHDGSLNSGFEIVTTPHKYQAFRQHNWKKILKELSETGATSHEKGTCGLHVHIGKTAYLRKHFIFRGESMNGARVYKQFFNLLEHDITRFSQRSEEKVGKWCGFNTDNHSRYSAVNLTPDDTIEIRIFRGTLYYPRFMASVQFGHAVLDFLTCHSKAVVLSGRRVMLEKLFRQWLETRGEYSLLVSYLKEKALFGFPPTYEAMKREKKVKPVRESYEDLPELRPTIY